jgi:hypothetical protein
MTRVMEEWEQPASDGWAVLFGYEPIEVIQRVPVICEECRADMNFKVVTSVALEQRTVTLYCPECGWVCDEATQMLLDVSAHVCGQGFGGEAPLGRIWTRA